ncbi:hypothetical protein PVAP13_5KG311507 [Panicum virgatum]|uniref:Uncharacterized protein n=1 Tax=Panicum virgatum TaxID=38727 RepID=A0A8T0SLN3_PANVG|nr:hypothetical protein PVAP13_5KG311507 [Panicum virgatum]
MIVFCMKESLFKSAADNAKLNSGHMIAARSIDQSEDQHLRKVFFLMRVIPDRFRLLKRVSTQSSFYMQAMQSVQNSVTSTPSKTPSHQGSTYECCYQTCMDKKLEGNLNLNGSIVLGAMPLSIQGVIKYRTIFSVAYLGCGCVRTTLCSIWIHVFVTLHTIYFLMKYFQFG